MRDRARLVPRLPPKIRLPNTTDTITWTQDITGISAPFRAVPYHEDGNVMMKVTLMVMAMMMMMLLLVVETIPVSMFSSCMSGGGMIIESFDPLTAATQLCLARLGQDVRGRCLFIGCR